MLLFMLRRGRGNMQARKLIDTLVLAEKLKDTMRHCYTTNGRRESVAEHCWMASLMAYLMKDEFPNVDMDKVVRMILIHDLGECFTGDVPVFNKTEADEQKEKELLYGWVKTLPEDFSKEMMALYEEMEKLETMEARIFKAIDGMEAVLQHNISDISTWLPNEFDLNQTYAMDRVGFSQYLKEVREELRKDTVKKIEGNKN